MNMLPCFTPEEMEAFGVNGNSDTNFYGVNSSEKSLGFWNFYKATGCVIPEYKDLLFKAYDKYALNDSLENRQYLLDLGWNPSVSLNYDTIERVSAITKEKLTNLKYAAYVVEMVDLVNEDADNGEPTTDTIHRDGNFVVSSEFEDIENIEENDKATIKTGANQMVGDDIGDDDIENLEEYSSEPHEQPTTDLLPIDGNIKIQAEYEDIEDIEEDANDEDINAARAFQNAIKDTVVCKLRDITPDDGGYVIAQTTGTHVDKVLTYLNNVPTLVNMFSNYHAEQRTAADGKLFMIYVFKNTVPPVE